MVTTPMVSETTGPDDPVLAQYEAYPFPGHPSGVPEQELPDWLGYLRPLLWSRRRDLSGLKVLDAGCGTGAMVSALARRHPGVDVLAIDMSARSLEAAARRLSGRDGARVRLRQLPIERADELGERFDLVVVWDVLHCVADPVGALRTLGGLLSPDGALVASVRAPHGRAGAAAFRSLMEALGLGLDCPDVLPRARALIDNLAPTHLFQRSEWQRDLSAGGDAALVDLLLPARERQHNALQVVDLVAESGLEFLRWFCPNVYRPRRYLTDAELLEPFELLGGAEQARAAELLHSRMRNHVFVAVRPGYAPDVPQIDGDDWLDAVAVPSPLFGWRDARQETGQHGEPVFAVTSEWEGTRATVRLRSWEALIVHLCASGQRLRDVCEHPKLASGLGPVSPAERTELVRGFLRRAIEDDYVLLAWA